MDVAICYTFVSPPQFWVLLQTLSCDRSTPVQLRLDFQSAASLNTVLELCDQLISQSKLFLAGNNFWEVCCFPAGFVPACHERYCRCARWRGRDHSRWCLHLILSALLSSFLFTFNKSVYEVSAVRYFLQEADQ